MALQSLADEITSQELKVKQRHSVTADARDPGDVRNWAMRLLSK